jgi:hypothetical protein
MKKTRIYFGISFIVFLMMAAILYAEHDLALTPLKSTLDGEPRYGVAYHIHSADRWGYQTCTPPMSGRGNDWLLILENEKADFPLP